VVLINLQKSWHHMIQVYSHRLPAYQPPAHRVHSHLREAPVTIVVVQNPTICVSDLNVELHVGHCDNILGPQLDQSSSEGFRMLELLTFS
jgi:hypothetical protein